MPRQSRQEPQRTLLHCYQYCQLGEIKNHEVALTRMRFTNKRKQQNTWGGQISCLLLFYDFWIQPQTSWHKKFSRYSLSPFFMLFSITNFFLHHGAGELSLGWICFSCTVSTMSSQCWDALSECYHTVHVWFGRLKSFSSSAIHASSPPPSLLTHHPSPGLLLPTPTHTAKAEALAVWYFWKC